MDEKVLRWVRGQAAEKETSVSRWVGEMLSEQMRRAQDQSQTLTDILRVMEEVPKGTGYGKRIPRSTAHERRP